MFKYKFILLTNIKNEAEHFSHAELRDEQNIININKEKLFILFLLIFTFYTLKRYLFINTNYADNFFSLSLNDSKNIMGNHSLYKLYEYDQISLLIYGIDNWKNNNTTLLKFFDYLKRQTLREIQIILVLPKELNFSMHHLINSAIKKNEKIGIFTQSENQELNTNYLINLIKGKFTIILDELVIFPDDEFEKLYMMTHGKINNIFEFQFQNTSFYLIKTKILMNLLDSGELFNNYNNLIKNIIQLPNPQLNYISIAMCPNDYYVPFTYVSMISILSTKDEFTFISFYLIISEEFQKKNIDFLNSLYEQFDFFNISFVKMNDRYKNAYISRRMTVQTYFRFSLGELFPFLTRILYLDSDIIVYKDLCKLFNLNFKGKMVLGQVTGYNRSKKTGIYHINNGILLFNLNLMRNLKIEEKVLQIIKKKQKLRYHDQTLMNHYFKDYIGIFPIEYHIRNWGNIEEGKSWNIKAGSVYDEDYFYFSQKYPYIRHFLGSQKPMKSDKNHIEDWWYFARKSKYYKKKSSKFEETFSFHIL